MNISDWKIAGQLRAAIVEIEAACRECCRISDVGPQILVWLNTERGKEVLTKALHTIIACWKTEYELPDRVDRFEIDPSGFEDLIGDCYFEGRLANITEKSFPSSNASLGKTIEFEEVASDRHMPQGGESGLLSSHGLRPAEPIEFLAWLRKNPKAGYLTSITCAVPNAECEYMYACICGGGGRGLHLNRPYPHTGWPPATVFLGVKIEAD